MGVIFLHKMFLLHNTSFRVQGKIYIFFVYKSLSLLLNIKIVDRVSSTCKCNFTKLYNIVIYISFSCQHQISINVLTDILVRQMFPIRTPDTLFKVTLPTHIRLIFYL